MGRKKKYKSTVIKFFKKNEKGKLTEYNINDTFTSTSLDTINNYKQLKLIK